MNFTFRAFLDHITNHMAQNLSRSCRKSTKNGVGRHHFRDLFGPLGPQFGPKQAQTGPLWPMTMAHCGTGEKRYLKYQNQTFFMYIWKNGPKNLYSRLSPLFFPGVDFYGFSIYFYSFQDFYKKIQAFSEHQLCQCAKFLVGKNSKICFSFLDKPLTSILQKSVCKNLENCRRRQKNRNGLPTILNSGLSGRL